MDNSRPARRSLLARMFLSADEPRLWAFWRLLIHFVILVVLTVLLLIPLVIFALMMGADTDVGLGMFAGSTILVVSVTVSVFFARRFLDHRSILSLGLGRKHALADLLAGIGIAGIMMGLVFGVEWALGWIKFVRLWREGVPLTFSVFVSLAYAFVAFVAVAWQEELLNRGYWMQNIAEGANLPVGAILSSALFALLHFANDFFSWRAFAGLFLAGLFLAFGYARTRQLWLPIGLHIGWNFFEGPVFGFPVSGMRTIQLIGHQQIEGLRWWTGGGFGPEAGLIILPAMALGVLLIYLYTRHRAAV